MNWITQHRRFALALICAFWVAAILAALSFPELPFLSAVANGEQSFQDLLRREGRSTPTRADFAFIGIDQQSLQLDALSEDEIAASRALQLMTEKSYPWSRELWVLLMDKLFAAGARLVMFDIVFSPLNDGDQAFAEALVRYRDQVVIGTNFDEQRGTLIGPNSALIPPPPDRDDRVGLVNFWPDGTDGVVRAVRFVTSERQLAGQAPFPGETLFESLSARGLTKLGRAVDVPRDFQFHAIRFSAADAYQPSNLWEIFFAKTWEANFANGTFFKDKIVIVGMSAQIMHDVVITPLGPSTYGPALHLHALAAALSHEFLTYSRPTLAYLLLGIAGLLSWILIAFLRRPILSLIALASITLGYLLTARLLYDQAGFFLMTVPVLAAFIGSGASSLGLDYVLERREKLKTRRTLERYVSKNLVKEILENPHGFYSSTKGARKPVTVLFSDLIGFTTLSERADPEELVRQLNEYLSAMVAVVFENEGTLDKFIGDAIMAVWGNVRSQGPAADAKAAARTALGMRKALKKLNDGWRTEGRMGLGMGIGINQGEALVGNIGSYAPNERLDPTVIGDAVNLASRLEALTRTYAVDILIGPTAADLIRDDFHLRSVACVQVKGKTRPVDVSTIIAEKGAEADADLLKWIDSYEEGLQKFRERDFTRAKTLFAGFSEIYPNDYLSKMYLDRATEYEKQPPDDSWSPAEVFTKK